MDISFQSLLLFIVITIIYFASPYLGKPKLTLDDLSSEVYEKTTVNKLGEVINSGIFTSNYSEFYIKNMKSLDYRI